MANVIEQDWVPGGPGWTRGTLTTQEGPGIFRWVVLGNLQDGTSLEDIRRALWPFGTVLEVLINGRMGFARFPLEADVVRVAQVLSSGAPLQVGPGRCRAFGRLPHIYGVSAIPASMNLVSFSC